MKIVQSIVPDFKWRAYKEENMLNLCQKPYLENTNKQECYCSGKPHMNHGQRNRKWKIEVLWRENPLQGHISKAK